MYHYTEDTSPQGDCRHITADIRQSAQPIMDISEFAKYRICTAQTVDKHQNASEPHHTDVLKIVSKRYINMSFILYAENIFTCIFAG